MIAPILADADMIGDDLVAMTRRWGELPEPAKFELRAFKEHASPQTALFPPSWIDEAVEWAVDMNERGYNIYVTRNPLRETVIGSAKDTDVIGSFFLWADCDDKDSAGNVYRFAGPKWTQAVITGNTPSIRVHTYWELEQPCTDMAEWRSMQETIARHFGSDRAVINPSRIMRLAGTVSHPDSRKAGKGYIKERAALRTYEDDRRPVTLEQMRRVFGETAVAPTFSIDAGAQPLDRERMRIQALGGQEWHHAVIRLVASYVARGLSDDEIHGLTDPLTLSGYTVDDTRREVQTAIDGARQKGWTPQEYATPEAIKEPEFDAPSRPHNLEWFDDAEPVLSDNYIVKGVLSQGSMSVVYGPSNSGKTFFALDMAFSIACGGPWRSRRVSKAAVLYLAAEGGRGVINRIAALRKTHGVCNVPLAVKRAGMDLLHDQADLQHIYELATSVVEKSGGLPLVIVVDTLSRVMAGGDENSAADMTALIRNVDAVREATNAHVMIVHHTGKDTARGARGHSSLRAATDTEIEVQNEEGCRAAIVTKQRDYQGGETFAFELKSVTLGADQDGDEVTSCVVECADDEGFKAAKKASRGKGKNQKIIMDTFDQMLAEGLGKPNPGGVGLPEPGRFWVVPTEELRRISQGKMVGSDTGKIFRVAWAALTEPGGLFCVAENLTWRIDRKKSK